MQQFGLLFLAYLELLPLFSNQIREKLLDIVLGYGVSLFCFLLAFNCFSNQFLSSSIVTNFSLINFKSFFIFVAKPSRRNASFLNQLRSFCKPTIFASFFIAVHSCLQLYFNCCLSVCCCSLLQLSTFFADFTVVVVVVDSCFVACNFPVGCKQCGKRISYTTECKKCNKHKFGLYL